MRPKRADEEDHLDYFPPSPRKPWSMGLAKSVSTLVIFVAGAVLGMSMSSQFTRYCNSHSELFFPRMMYSVNCDKECLGIGKFVRPAHLMLSMTDDELFWRASMVPRRDGYPFRRVPKVAFMFLTRGPLPFAPLWDRFFRGHQGLYSVYVHTLPDYKLNVSETSVFYGCQIPSDVRASPINSSLVCIYVARTRTVLTLRHFRHERNRLGTFSRYQTPIQPPSTPSSSPLSLLGEECHIFCNFGPRSILKSVAPTGCIEHRMTALSHSRWSIRPDAMAIDLFRE